MATQAEIDAGILGRVADAAHVLYLNDREHRLVISGLLRLRHDIRSDMKRARAKGWKPAPGKLDNNALRLEGVDALLKRYRP